MKASVLRKHYPSLTADERFSLALAALARGDDDDLAVLRMTCPMRTYDATDEAFQGQWEASARVMHHFRTCWLISLLRLREAEIMLVRVQTALDYLSEGYTHGANGLCPGTSVDSSTLRAPLLCACSGHAPPLSVAATESHLLIDVSGW
jgi:hypothetical protein